MCSETLPAYIIDCQILDLQGPYTYSGSLCLYWLVTYYIMLSVCLGLVSVWKLKWLYSQLLLVLKMKVCSVITLRIKCGYCRPSYEWTFYVQISEITDEICWFWNFGPQWECVELAVLTVNKRSSRWWRRETHAQSLLTLAWGYYMYALVFIQYCITVLVTF